MNCCFCNKEMGKTEIYDLSLCPSCHVYARDPQPTRIQWLHGGRNFMLGASKEQNKRESRLTEAHRQVAVLNENLVSNLPKLVYDVGAAGGFFLHTACNSGWDASGNDISMKSIEWAADELAISIFYGMLEDLPPTYNTYSAMVLWNSLEHTLNPADTLRLCDMMLVQEPGALIYLNVPTKTTQEVEQHYDGGHLWEMSESSVKNFMDTLGFERIINEHKICFAGHYVESLYRRK